MRNIWAYSIIFCGHFPTGVATFTEEETRGRDRRGHWYIRQMLGSANITGGKLFHIMSGNLSHQIEHHLFPDLPARRYPQIAAEVREICARATACRTTPAAAPSSCSAWPRRSAAWRCPGLRRGGEPDTLAGRGRRARGCLNVRD